MPPMTPPAMAPVRARLEAAPTGRAVCDEAGDEMLVEVEEEVGEGELLEVEDGVAG